MAPNTHKMTMTKFDPEAAVNSIMQRGHAGWLGLTFAGAGENWVSLRLPWREDLLGENSRNVLSSGPIISLLDMASGLCIWTKMGEYQPMATLDLRVDYHRPARENQAVIGKVECYRTTRSAVFVRGIAHDGDEENPIAHMAAVFMRVSGAPIAEDESAAPHHIGESFTPYAAALGIRTHDHEQGVPVLQMPFSRHTEGRSGVLHGGATAGLLETAAYSALRGQLAAQAEDGQEGASSVQLKPINITVQYLAPAKSQPTLAKATIIKMGRRSAHVSVEAWQDRRDRPVALAAMNILLAPISD